MPTFMIPAQRTTENVSHREREIAKSAGKSEDLYKIDAAYDVKQAELPCGGRRESATSCSPPGYRHYWPDE